MQITFGTQSSTQTEVATIATCSYLPPQPCKRGSWCPDHNNAAVVVHGETPPEEIATPAVARRKLGGLLPSTVRLSPLPAPGAVETPHFGLLPAVVFLAADRRGRGGRGSCGFAGGRNDETGKQVDGSGARGVILSGDVVGLRRDRSGCGHIGGPDARAVGVEAGGVAVRVGWLGVPSRGSCVDGIRFSSSGRIFSGLVLRLP